MSKERDEPLNKASSSDPDQPRRAARLDDAQVFTPPPPQRAYDYGASIPHRRNAAQYERRGDYVPVGRVPNHRLRNPTQTLFGKRFPYRSENAFSNAYYYTPQTPQLPDPRPAPRRRKRNLKRGDRIARKFYRMQDSESEPAPLPAPNGPFTGAGLAVYRERKRRGAFTNAGVEEYKKKKRQV